MTQNWPNAPNQVRASAVYCLLDEVLWHGEIVPDPRKKLTFKFFYTFPSNMPESQENEEFFFKICTNHVEFDHNYNRNQLSLLFIFFPPTVVKRQIVPLFMYDSSLTSPVAFCVQMAVCTTRLSGTSSTLSERIVLHQLKSRKLGLVWRWKMIWNWQTSWLLLIRELVH